MLKHKVLVCNTSDELEQRLNEAAEEGFMPHNINLFPAGLSVLFFAHMTKEVKDEPKAVVKPPVAPVAEPEREEVVVEAKVLKSVKSSSGMTDRKEVHDLWAELFKKAKTRFRSGGKRDRKIAKAIKEFGKDDVVKSIKGHALNEWRHGSPTRCELATLLRDEQNIEAGIEIFDKGGVKDDFKRDARGNSTIDFTNDTRGQRGGFESFDGPLRDYNA